MFVWCDSNMFVCRMFQAYDLDGDGRISIYDLKLALEIQHGRSYSIDSGDGEDYALLCAWIRERDTTNTLHVNYDDFVAHYTSVGQ
jgi:Ca2+-binding EF-hand superfamily protein